MPKITIKCYATLGTYCPPEGVLALPEPTDIAALVTMLEIPPEEVKLIFVNGKRADTDQVLAEGDRVGLFPPVGGG
jgi:sulfur carrier protein ThiS